MIEQYLRPRFGNRPLDQIKRDDIKAMINELIAKALSRNTVRNALCVIRGIFNEAIEAGMVEVNPAARLGRFTRTARTAEVKGRSLTSAEAEQFLQAAKEICPEYYPLFLMALRAGLRRGELVAVQWGDLQFGRDAQDANRFIVVEHNYVRREHTTTKSKKSRRVDMSRELRRVLIDLRDKRLLDSFLKGKNDISDELVFLSPDGAILDPDNLYHRYFRPVLSKAGLRKIRLHDLRHYAESETMPNRDSETLRKQRESCGDSVVPLDPMRHSPVCFTGHGGSSAFAIRSFNDPPLPLVSVGGAQTNASARLVSMQVKNVRPRMSLANPLMDLFGISIFGWRQTMPNR